MIILFTVQAVVPQVNIKSLQAEVAQLKKENEIDNDGARQKLVTRLTRVHPGF
jgi:hypothetical protein